MTSNPHALKEIVVKAYAARYGIETFVETGTFRGAMVQAVISSFKEIYSIELDPMLHAEARQRFESFSHIHILDGHSAVRLGQLIEIIDKPTLFWLDAHYSGAGTARGNEDTPILEELSIIAAHPYPDVILIDDARLFGENGWPSLELIQNAINPARMLLTVEDDIIRLEPRQI